jgi:hypothetical protein
MLSSALAHLWRSRPPRTPCIFLYTVLPCGSPRPIGNIDAFFQFRSTSLPSVTLDEQTIFCLLQHPLFDFFQVLTFVKYHNKTRTQHFFAQSQEINTRHDLLTWTNPSWIYRVESSVNSLLSICHLL